MREEGKKKKYGTQEKWNIQINYNVIIIVEIIIIINNSIAVRREFSHPNARVDHVFLLCFYLYLYLQFIIFHRKATKRL